MNQKMTRVALCGAAFMAILATAAACGGSKKSSTPPATLDPAVKPDGTTAANLACNGSNDDPASLGSSVTITLHTVQQPISGSTFPDLPNTDVALYDVANGTTSGSVVTNSAAIATMSVPDSTRVAFALNHAPTGGTQFVPTYQFNDLTPVAGSGSSSVFNLRVIPTTISQAFIGFLGVTPPTGSAQFAAAVTDCDGDPLQNVVVADIPMCTGGSSTYPCAAYFANGAPNSNATHTDASGQVVVVGVTPGSPYTVKVNAVPSAGAAETQIGQMTINAQANSIALGTFEPLSSNP